MSNAKKCDICGNFYELGQSGRPIVEDPTDKDSTCYFTQLTISCIVDNDRMSEKYKTQYYRIKDLELCPKCARVIYSFIDQELNIKED